MQFSDKMWSVNYCSLSQVANKVEIIKSMKLLKITKLLPN